MTVLWLTFPLRIWIARKLLMGSVRIAGTALAIAPEILPEKRPS